MNHNKAKDLLSTALEQAFDPNYSPKHRRSAEIGEIILGTHLTFRYILVTGVLGKATDKSIHPRSLQSGSDLAGAYDARSLCHKVFVPFEREFLSDALGGSNEPYLNKPARFKDVDTGNAVRAGYDRMMLGKLHSVLEELNGASSQDAFDALCDCLYFCGKRIASRKKLLPVASESTDGLQSIIRFVDILVAKSFEGETSALAVGSALSSLSGLFSEEYRVIVHPTNQAGTSSNEVSDVDAYLEDSLRYTVEVKDKEFTFEDVQHACKKAQEANHDSLIFVIGPQGRLKFDSLADVESRLSSENFSVVFVSLGEFVRSMLAIAPNPSAAEFYSYIIDHSSHARVKDKTLEHLSKCAKTVGWI